MFLISLTRLSRKLRNVQLACWSVLSFLVITHCFCDTPGEFCRIVAGCGPPDCRLIAGNCTHDIWIGTLQCTGWEKEICVFSEVMLWMVFTHFNPFTLKWKYGLRLLTVLAPFFVFLFTLDLGGVSGATTVGWFLSLVDSAWCFFIFGGEPSGIF